MILKRIRTEFCGRTQNVTKQVYRVGRATARKYILGVYTPDTAKFYPCDRNGKRLSNKTLDLVCPPDKMSTVKRNDGPINDYLE